MRLRHCHPNLANTIQCPRAEPFGHPVFKSLSRLIHAVEEVVRQEFAKISRERLRRRRIRTLQGLSDRQLLDIGVERADITERVEEILERKARPE